MERISGGRFGLGNQTSKSGGAARSQKLTPERRSEISRSGWDARVQKHFGGDYDAARDYMRELGIWSYENQVGIDNAAGRAQHPGTAADFMARRFQLRLIS